MGIYDIPAQVNYILDNTSKNHEKLAAYIGHSEGTTQFFIGSSLKPEYFKEKIGLFVGLAPIVRLDHANNGLMVLASQMWPFLTEVI